MSITTDNYEYTTTLCKLLFDKRITNIKNQYKDLMSETPEREWNVSYRGNIVQMAFYSMSNRTYNLEEGHPAEQLVKQMLKIKEQQEMLQQYIRQLVLKWGVPYMVKTALGFENGEYLDDCAKVEVDIWKEENPEIPKFCKRLRLLADMAK